MLSSEDKVLISKLKSRLSKILNLKDNLLKKEKSSLEGIYSTLDKLILGDEEYKDKNILIDSLSNNLSLIENSKKEYIKNYIVPLVDKLAVKKWKEDKDE